MSKSREAHRRATLAAGKGRDDRANRAAPATPRGSDDFPPLKPQRGLFIVMGLLLIALCGGLLALYFTTVYPHRHDVHAVETDYPNGAAPSANK
ncbi:MAG TPA: hypothetical protein VFC78_02595 [Tepidisphaeraceae bacterium]|nr:hypothetical protein [Tepidisphaeraceae bacterium]